MNKTKNKINQTTFLIVILLFVSSNILAQSVAPNQTVAAKIDEYMNAAVKVNNFSGSILVARDGQPVISKGYGLANYELDVPNTPQTVFRLGSITKPFTAAGVMILQERGKLNVNDSICKHLADCPAAWQTVTIRHLLTHTSGIPPTFANLPEYRRTMSLPVTHQITLERLRNKPLEFAPGEKAVYSNSGFYLLGVIVERASGQSYAEFLQENVFKPLGLIGTGYETNSRIIKNRANGYAMQGGSRVNAAYIDMSIPFAAGALYSTVEDLLRFDQALHAEKILSRKSLDEMFTPFKEVYPGINYGYGWGIAKQLDRQALLHKGDIDGFSNFIARFPADRTTIIVLGNNNSVNAVWIANDLTAIAFGAPYKIPEARKKIALDPKTLEKFIGQYQPPEGSVITVTFENGKLMRQVGAQPKAEMFAESATDFFLAGNDLQISFVLDAQGRVTGQLLRRRDSEAFAPKIK